MNSVMPWLDRLSEVGTPILNERDRIADHLKEANELERQVKELREKAQIRAAALEERVSEKWTAAEILVAKARAGAGAVKNCLIGPFA